MFAEMGRNPCDGEALDITVMAHDLERRGGKPQIGKVGVFEAHLGLNGFAGVARNNVTQVMDTDSGRQLVRNLGHFEFAQLPSHFPSLIPHGQPFHCSISASLA